MAKELNDRQRAWLEQFTGYGSSGAFIRVPITWGNYKFMRALTEGSMAHSMHGNYQAAVCEDGCCYSTTAISQADIDSAQIAALLGGEEKAIEFMLAMCDKTSISGMN